MIPWRTVLLALVLATSGISALHAQEMKKKAKPKVILQRDRLAQQFDTVDVVKNVIKLNPLLFFRGEIPLYYERALTHRLSAEVAIGFTWRNYLNVSFAG